MKNQAQNKLLYIKNLRETRSQAYVIACYYNFVDPKMFIQKIRGIMN